MSPRRRRWLLTCLTLLVIGFYVWRSSGEFAHLLAGVDGARFAGRWLLVLALSAIGPWVNGTVSRELVARFGVSLGRHEAYALAVINAFGNLAPVPQAGALARGVYLKRVHGLDYSPYAATLLVTYVSALSLTGFVGLLGLSWLWLLGRPVMWLLAAGFAALAALGLLFTPLAAAVPLPARLSGFREGLGRLRHQHLLLRIVFLQSILIILSATGLWLSATSLTAAPVAWQDTLMLGLVSTVAAVANVLGVEQLASAACAVLLGINPELALATSALYRLSGIALILVLGPLAARALDQRAHTAPTTSSRA